RSRAAKYYARLHGGTHLDWTNILCVGTLRIADCLASRPNARLINAYAFAFLDRYVKGQPQALRRLDGAGLEDYRSMAPCRVGAAARSRGARPGRAARAARFPATADVRRSAAALVLERQFELHPVRQPAALDVHVLLDDPAHAKVAQALRGHVDRC